MTVHDPRDAADGGASRDELTADDSTLWRDNALHQKAGGRVETHGFLDTGIEVGKLGSCVPGSDCVLAGEGTFEFVLEFGKDLGVLSDVEEK